MIPREEQERIKNQIRQLIEAGNSIDTILQLTKINRRTFFRYKKKIIKEIIKEYKPEPNSIEYEDSMVIKALEDCYNTNKAIMDNPRSSENARIAASEMSVVARVQLSKFRREGWIGKPQLPVPSDSNSKVIPIEGKEVKPQ
jgi:hypothetical protein